MVNPRKKYLLILSILIMTAVIALLPKFVLASRQEADPLSTAVTPEPYPDSDIYPAQVYLATRDDLQILYELKIDLEGLKGVDVAPSPGNEDFRPSIATIYINPEQSYALGEAGLNPIPIPNEGYRSYLAYGPGSGVPYAWPTFDAYVSRMQDLEAAHPNIVKLISIGTSVQHRGLYCMEITDNPGVEENKPEFKYTANHHGDETTGVEMTMRLAELLANSYGSDPAITDMVDKMDIWLCPIYNPDGYANGSRYNADGVDLNRDFPDRFTDPIDDPAGREPETQAFMNFGYAHRFVMGANYHGGAQVLNYPWDAVDGPPYYAPDDQLFFDFGYGYTSRNTDLWNGGWPYGMTRGWEWYYVYGGMQDWAYYYHGEHHVTLEISNTKMPPFNQMDTYWSHNRDAMLWWMQRAWTGLSGLVLDARDSTPLDAKITLVDREVPNIILTDKQVGDYHRVISEGTYTLEAVSEGYLSQTGNVTVYSGTLTTLNFNLCPDIPWTVSGVITDALSGYPLLATIEFIGSLQVVNSDPSNGQYSIQVCPSSYTMHVSAPWHISQDRQVNIDHDQTQNFALEPTSNLSQSTKLSSAAQVLPEQHVLYKLHVENTGTLASVNVTDTLPISLTWSGELTATQGIPTFSNSQILWQGEVTPSQPVTITYGVTVNQCLPAGTAILNIAQFDDHVNSPITGKVELEVDNAVPSMPGLPFPLDGSLSVPISTTLAWEASSDLNCDSLTYTIYFGTENPPQTAYELIGPSFDPGGLEAGTTYYWYVDVEDGITTLSGPVWQFTTAESSSTLLKIFLPLARK